MEMDKALRIQIQARDSVKTVQSYLTDLQNWEAEMKRKEAALKGEFEQDLPPVRSKVKKKKPVVPVKKKPIKRIAGSDYSAWDKFDVDRACEEVDMEDIGPPSLDGKKSSTAKMEKLREEAQYEKERGNNFVKKEKWDEALACYNRAIELVKDDAIYFANRGLCYLKKDSLHQAESDCTEALRLDPTYVKAYQRRAAAREKLGSLRAASHDLAEVLRLKPNNAAARRLLTEIKARMGTKGTKSKSSPSSTPTVESKPFAAATQPKIVELEDAPVALTTKEEVKTEVSKELSPMERWKNGVGENVTVLKPVKKPPHLRSKRALRTIPIKEIKLGRSEPEKPNGRIKIVEIESDRSAGDTSRNKDRNILAGDGDILQKDKGAGDTKSSQLNGNQSPESEKLRDDRLVQEKLLQLEGLVPKQQCKLDSLTPPVNSVQFMIEWKNLKGNDEARSHYLSLIDPKKLPSIFTNALESDTLSELLHVIHQNKQKFREKSVTAYLKGLVGVKRFSALAMFLSHSDKELINKLLVHCRAVEGCAEGEVADLKNKFEL